MTTTNETPVDIESLPVPVKPDIAKTAKDRKKKVKWVLAGIVAFAVVLGGTLTAAFVLTPETDDVPTLEELHEPARMKAIDEKVWAMNDDDLSRVVREMGIPASLEAEFRTILAHAPHELNDWLTEALAGHANSTAFESNTLGDASDAIEEIPAADEATTELSNVSEAAVEGASMASGNRRLNTIGTFVAQQMEAIIPRAMTDAFDDMRDSLKPSGVTLTDGQLDQLTKWALKERTIADQPCYRWYRNDFPGPATVCPRHYPENDVFGGCWPSGPAVYDAGRYCANGHSVCWPWDWRQRSCRSGYTTIGGTCWKQRGTDANCQSGYTKIGPCAGGSCCHRDDKYPDTGFTYSCRADALGSACAQNQDCASGTVQCLDRCSSDSFSCVEETVNQVTSVGIVAANIVTFGTVGNAAKVATKSAKVVRAGGKKSTMVGKLIPLINQMYKLGKRVSRLHKANKGLEKSAELVSTANDVIGAFGDMRSFISGESGALGLLTSDYVEDKAKALLGGGSANYKALEMHVAFELVFVVAFEMLAEFVDDLIGFEPTGLYDVYTAFAFGHCLNHEEPPRLAALALDDSLGNLNGRARPGQYGLCQGDCDKDSDCAGGLVCFQRSGKTNVPGCWGTTTNNWDYCIAPTVSAPALDESLGNLNGRAIPGQYGLCQGDCDKDSDCARGLKCFQRSGKTNVPGCSGTGTKDWVDYCVAA